MLARLGCALLLGLALAGSAGAQGRSGRPGEFDLYVLSLSWSPTYCLTSGDDRRDRLQCGASRPHAFVLHGLWPQYERGWPEFCGGSNAPRVPDGTIARMLDIMPSRGLVIHEWRKHGTCSGLAPQAYFDAARRAFERIVIPEAYREARPSPATSPDAVEAAFVAANPGLTRDMIGVTCRDGLLEEVRVCLSRTFQPRRCAEAVASTCRARTLRIPGAR